MNDKLFFKKTLFLCGIWAIFFASFAFNALLIIPEKDFANFQRDSQSLVKLKLIELSSGGALWEGGFLRMNKQFFQHQPPERPDDPSSNTRYNSQFGLQGMLIAAVHGMFHGTPEKTTQVAEKLVAFITAGLLAAFCLKIFARFGIVPGNVAVCLVLFSVHILLYARNLYWMSFLIYAPYLCSFFFYARAVERTVRLEWLAMAVGTLIYLKCLCGYEFITVLILGPSSFLLFEGLRRRFAIKKIIGHQVLFGVVGLLGFAAAICTHLGFLTFQLGGLDAAWSAFAERVSQNTYDSSSLATDAFASKYLGSFGQILAVMKYLSFTAFNVGSYPNFGDGEYYAARVTYYGLVILAGLIVILALWLRRSLGPGNSMTPLLAGVFLSLPWSFLCSVSWILLARTHTIHHFHLCSIVFIAPFFLHLAWSAGVVSFVLLGTAKTPSSETESPQL